MDIRKPGPIHGWRDFLVEIGTIVIGIGIALAAEQLVEVAQARHRIREIETTMTLELAEDDGPQAYERLAVSPCLSAQLDRLQAALVAERDHGTPFVPGAPYDPPSHTWDEDGWRAAGSSDVFTHMSIAAISRWANPYEQIPGLDRANFVEFRDAAALGGPTAASPHPDPAERLAMLDLVRRLRGDDAFMTHASAALLRNIREAGIRIPVATTDAILAIERARYGACVRTPVIPTRAAGAPLAG